VIVIALDGIPEREAHPDAPERKRARPSTCCRCGGFIPKGTARNGDAHLDCSRPHMAARTDR
jgi:hypothetical protein